ncbi:PKD domain-containing protein [Kitasatospora sp. NPDC089913]|uniref:PKD domain-containing protein n=1 Tax=Streptomycetaceae TaxID=2062 RepID=UPI00087CBD50|nr:PKD domain-containing protein [Streptomyces sp. TLI_053]SDT73424.1 serine protease [Streptomyces sp. TLI_053]
MRSTRTVGAAVLAVSALGGLPLAAPAHAESSLQPNLTVNVFRPGYAEADRPLRAVASTGGPAESADPVVANTLDFGDGTVVNAAEAPQSSYSHDYARAGTYTVTRTITDDKGRTGTVSRSVTVGSSYVPLYYPTRYLDTRTGQGAPVGQLGPRGVLKLQVTGVNGVTGVPTDRPVTAVMLNLTVTNATEPTHVTAFAGGEVPTASNVNAVPGRDVANAVLVPLAEDGSVSFYNNAGEADLVVDILGYYTPEPRSASVRLGTTRNAVRVLDTRTGTGGHPRPLAAGELMTTKVHGPGLLPTDARIAVVNLTATEGTASSYITVAPANAHPTTSSLNFAVGQTVANHLSAPVNANGTITYYNHVGEVNLLTDIQGYYASAISNADVKPVVVTAPTRVVDTRVSHGALGERETLKVKVKGVGGVPDGVSAVMVNLTATNATQDSWLKVSMPGSDWTDASNVNVTPGATVPNVALVPVDSEGFIEVYNNAGSTDVVVDLQGYTA